MFSYFNSIQGEIKPCKKEDFNRIVQSKRVETAINSISDAAEQWRKGLIDEVGFTGHKTATKRRLPGFCFMMKGRVGRRQAAGSEPSGLIMIDIDHIADPAAEWARIQRILKEKQLLTLVALVHVTPSGEGLRVVFVTPFKEMEIPYAQLWFSDLCQIAHPDRVCKDVSRASFAVPTKYILHRVDEALFTTDDYYRAYATAWTEAMGSGYLPPTMEALERRTVAETVSPPDAVSQPAAEADLPTAYKGIPYERIIGVWFSLVGGEPVEGERNEKLHRLAAHLRYVCDNREELILKILPRYDLPEEEVRALVHSACTAKFGYMPRLMAEAVKRASGEATEPTADTDEPQGMQPPLLPERQPRLIRLLLSRQPRVYQEAVAGGCFPSLAANLCGVTFRYLDNRLHEATLCDVLCAPSASGKDCVSPMIDHNLQLIRQQDAENLVREREYMDKAARLGANKERPRRPEHLVIQEIPNADITLPAFFRRTSESEGHFLYSKLNEIYQFDRFGGGGQGRQAIMTLFCNNFDYGNVMGQTRVGEKSVSETVTVRYLWNASGTPARVKKFFAGYINDGPISRVSFSTIPDAGFGADIPIFGEYDAAYDEALRPYLERLRAAKGEIHCAELQTEIAAIKDAYLDRIAETEDKVLRSLSRRALVIGWLKGYVLYVANGCEWEPEIADFVRWSIDYDLYCKFALFGEPLREEMLAEVEAVKPRYRGGRRAVITELPDPFTLSELTAAMAKLKARTKPNMLVNTWLNRRLISETAEGQYQKTAKYHRIYQK